jgi:hypothetical protein
MAPGRTRAFLRVHTIDRLGLRHGNAVCSQFIPGLLRFAIHLSTHTKLYRTRFRMMQGRGRNNFALFIVFATSVGHGVAQAPPPPIPPGSGSCTNVSSTGFTVSYEAWLGSPANTSAAAYVGLFRSVSTPLSQPSALLIATRSVEIGNESGAVDAVATAHGLLAPATTYTMRWRFRPALNDSTINFGFGWGAWGALFNCTTLNASFDTPSRPSEMSAASKTPARSTQLMPAKHTNTSARVPRVGATSVGKDADSARHAIHAARPSATAKTIRLYRSSEFTIDDVDFLSNHNSADERGEVRNIYPPIQPSSDSQSQ